MKGLHEFQRILLLFFLILSLNCFQELRSEAQSLHPDEVKTLGVIAQRLNIKDWDTNENPCNGRWNSTGFRYIRRGFVCNCTTTVCHITTIELKGQNLTGELPEEFADLTRLQDLDLTFNYLNGSIPPRWATLPLVHLSIFGNRVTGKIPKEFGNINTLKSLVLEDNLLGGPFPPELGNLSRLEEL
ncbi:putative LRR receptor-like serine/threonine-protein kinase [Cinnamomum micranthum f. kanehirae]|uniref:Putative LRR receptor-like serine/threonine-protein kinase n=1 Tax=Cinnamomum micranthum f. kanehirae TaxID=337451 RepID=A0A3S4P6X6_9MAGN|nr:putative LRR receptor-like serine/threonine-protein kinase [Cinnamomum micranthum f. kanehirae]